MASTKRTATVVALVALGVLAFGALANADDDVPDEPPDDEPDEPPPIIVDPWEPPPPAPNPLVCNYVGCAELNPPGAPDYNWPRKDMFPNYRSFGIALEALGYVQQPPPASAEWSVVSASFMTEVRDFQRDYNLVRQVQTVDDEPPAIDEDGLIGNRTIAAIVNAQRWVQTLGLSWSQLVEAAEAL